MAKKKTVKETKVVPSLPDMTNSKKVEDCWREIVMCDGKLCVVVDSDPEVLNLATGEIEDIAFSFPVRKVRLTEIHWEYID